MGLAAFLFLTVLTGGGLGYGQTSFRVRKESDGFNYIDNVAFDELHKQSRGMAILYTDRYTCPECSEVRVKMAAMSTEFTTPYPEEPNFFVLDCSQYPDTCKAKLIDRILPAIDFVIYRHVHHYKGDFSEASLRRAIAKHFSTTRLVPFKLTTYLQRLSESRKKGRGVVVFNHRVGGTHGSYMLGLSRLEHEDFFFYCDDDPNCLELFADHPSDNVAFIFEGKVEFHHMTKHLRFDDLYLAYRDFKSPFFIPFGEPFRKKIMEEKVPAAVYLVSGDDPKTLQDVAYFRREVKKHFTRLYHSVVNVDDLNEAEHELMEEFLESVGLMHYGLPILFIVEKDPKKNALRKYYVTRDHWEHELIHHTIEAWHYGKLNVWKKSQHRFDSKHGHVRVISHETFKTVVHMGPHDKAVLLHHNLDQDPKSRQFYEQFNALAATEKVKGLDFLMMDLDKNDPYIEVSRVPCVQIFLKDQWETPVVFEGLENDLSGLEKILEKRNLWRKVAKNEAKKTESDDEDSEDEEL